MNLHERLAELMHTQWSEYMTYFLERLPQDDQGNLLITPAYYENLWDLAKTSYPNLPVHQKNLDRTEAERVLSILDLQDRSHYWRMMTFPNSTFQSVYAHFKRELKEFEKNPSATEAADILLLLMGMSEYLGFNLLDAAEQKFEEVQLRTWGEPDAQGVVEHVREGA